MLEDDQGPADWELKDEEPPERLKKKWAKDEALGSRRIACPSCKQETPAENLTCIFCSSSILQEGCPMSCLFGWIKRLFKKG